MDHQLTFDGRAEPLPLHKAKTLTQRQRDLLLWLRMTYPTTTASAGRFYADPSGALRRLEALGLVERVSRGRWAPCNDESRPWAASEGAMEV